MNIWLTSDWHLGEPPERIKILQRPFDTTIQMVETLIENYNKLVKPNDLVYVVGDVCYKETPEYIKYVDSFVGQKTLIRGNHDRVFDDNKLFDYFEDVIQEGEGLKTFVESIPLYITHYPTKGRLDRFNLVGHIHSIWKHQLNMINVGVDVHHFRPINIDEIPKIINSIETYYDADAWISYNEINKSYYDKRGLKTSYFS